MKWRLSTDRNRTPIIGLAFNDREISMSVFPENESVPITCITAPLRSGAIVNGHISDREAVRSAVVTLLKSKPRNTTAAIVSLPSIITFSTLFSLPQPIKDIEKAKQSAKLLVPGVLPWDKDETYFYFKIASRESDETRSVVVVLAAQKNSIDNYADLLLSVGITPLAIETDASSQVRLLDVSKNSDIISLTTGETHAYISASKGSEVNFLFPFPLDHALDIEKLETESERVRTYVSLELGIDFPPAANTPGYRTEIINRLPRGANTPAGYAACGAALRGLLLSKSPEENRADPTSLLPLPPETILGFENLLSSLRFARIGGIAIVLLYVSISIIALLTFNEIAKPHSSATPETSITKEVARMQVEFKMTASIIGSLNVIAQSSMKWSDSLSAIDSVITPGITLTSVSGDRSTGPYQISGIAGTRSQFNQFRGAITSNPSIRAPKVPLGNADLGTRIPFTATLYANSISP